VTFYPDSDAARNAGITYHLIPTAVWESVQGAMSYTPEAYEADGFIHCTNGIDQMVQVANWFYTADTRPFNVLALNVSAIGSDVRYDDDEHTFPHVYGPLNLDAVVDVLDVERGPDGAFVSISPRN
jgi:uncharacterized protein (DUF952 family)